MPTGYTSGLYNGKEVSFEEFVLGCARAFGALVTMRDDPTDAKIPDRFEPTKYHASQLQESRRRLAEAREWTEEEAAAKARDDYEQACAAMEERKASDAELRLRYEGMLAQVEAWTPPTSEHEGLKEFMTSQLRESIKFDTSYEHPTPILLAGADYREQAITRLERDIAYHEREDAAERERAESRTEWVRALRESLGQVPA